MIAYHNIIVDSVKKLCFEKLLNCHQMLATDVENFKLIEP